MVRADPVGGGGRRAPVAVVFEDVAHVAVLAGADLQGQHAGRLEARLAVALRQRQQAQAGAVAVLGMAVLGHQARHRLGRRRADARAPVDQARGRPFHLGAVRRRHVRGRRRKAALPAVARVAGDALAAMHELDHGRRQARLKLLPDQRVRHAVAVALDLDVVVDVHPDGLERRHLVALQRQRHQGRRIDLGEGAGAAAGQFLERLVVEAREQRRHSLINLVHAGEALVAQARHDPTLDDLHRRFGLGLIVGQQMLSMTTATHP